MRCSSLSYKVVYIIIHHKLTTDVILKVSLMFYFNPGTYIHSVIMYSQICVQISQGDHLYDPVYIWLTASPCPYSQARSHMFTVQKSAKYFRRCKYGILPEIIVQNTPDYFMINIKKIDSILFVPSLEFKFLK